MTAAAMRRAPKPSLNRAVPITVPKNDAALAHAETGASGKDLRCGEIGQIARH
jgi:hypothetical protein